MGSKGTNKFTDFPGTPSSSAKGSGQSGAGKGGQPEIDQCERKLADIALEEVGRCEYVADHGGLPPAGMPVTLRTALVGGRLAVESVDSKEVIGFLPTEFNYLLQCTKQGYSYTGTVKSVRPRPVPVVRVDLEPQK